MLTWLWTLVRLGWTASTGHPEGDRVACCPLGREGACEQGSRDVQAKLGLQVTPPHQQEREGTALVDSQNSCMFTTCLLGLSPDWPPKCSQQWPGIPDPLTSTFQVRGQLACAITLSLYGEPRGSHVPGEASAT